MNNIVVVVDVQNGFTQKEATKGLPEKIGKLLSTDAFDAVVATRFLNGDDSIYEKLFNWTALKDEEECALVPEVMEYADCVVDKYIYNCVTPTFLQKLCQLNDGKYPEQVFVVGADTDCCVLATAMSLFECNIRPVVLTQYCASNGGEESHLAGIKCMLRLIDGKQLYDNEITSRQDLENI